jgi:hypothetical protein
MKKLQKDTKLLLFENMVKLNPDFKLKEGIGNFHDSFHERTGQIFKDANDAWSNGAFHIRYKMLVKLGIPDNIAEQYAMKYANNPWDEVKSLLGKSGMNEDDKWIQKAVNPKHKGYCTPMTKSTCTPARKALAKRFKKGIDEELNLSNVNNPEEERIKVDKIKNAIDDLFNKQEFDVLDTLYRLLINKTKKIGLSQNVNEDNTQEYQKKAELIKEKVNFLFDNNNYDTINKIDNIMTKFSPKEKNSETGMNEFAGKPQNDTYFETLSAALDAVRERVEKKGFTVDEDDMFTQFGTGGINYGETKRATIPLLRNGIPDKRRSVTIAIYRMDSGKYELTAYLN